MRAEIARQKEEEAKQKAALMATISNLKKDDKYQIVDFQIPVDPNSDFISKECWCWLTFPTKETAIKAATICPSWIKSLTQIWFIQHLLTYSHV